MNSRWWFYPAIVTLAFVLLPVLLFLFAAMITYPTLPSLDALTDYRPKIPLRVYTSDGVLIGEFGEERRAVVKIENVPPMMKKAILAAEDDRFYQHGGIDFIGVLRAAYSNFVSGKVRQGASTITMQVARNFFLTKARTFSRKFNEALLSYKIEHSLSKDDILQLYINQIYLGQRAYGFAAAAQVYFGKPLDQLNIAEMAVLAGLPKAPSAYNPVVNPKRAKLRQLYVLRRMHALGDITDQQYAAAKKQPLVIAKHGGRKFAVHADYVAEMVRQTMYRHYHDEAYNEGFKVYTTIRAFDQNAAYKAVRKGVEEYDHRHGYRGPEDYINLRKDGDSETALQQDLQSVSNNGNLIPAIVLSIDRKGVHAYCKNGQTVVIHGAGLHFVRHALSHRVALRHRIRPGSVIRVKQNAKGAWAVTQLPQVEAAFVSADPRTGAIYSLVGGFNFNHSQFNHVTQAWRQPGSSFKPFIYSAALEKGFTPASVINDAPLVIDPSETGGNTWQPKNYEGTYDGPMRMRDALAESKNLVSIRILQAITPQYAQDYVTKFGFDADKNPPYLTMALGAGSVTPMQMLGGYSVFANGGYRVKPYYIERVEDANGNVLSKAEPAVADKNAERIIDVRNAFTMVSMMQSVIQEGTGRHALRLGRQDLAGKTGTTSDSMDAWFCGFQPTVVGISWLGFDTPRSLGERETGGGAALPIWMAYMGAVLKNVPEAEYIMPDGMVAARINARGYRDPNGDRIDYFYKENVPPLQSSLPAPAATQTSDAVKDQLF